MRSLYLFLLNFLFLAAPAFAQDFVWMKQIGGTANEEFTDKAFDGNQQLICVGNTQGTVDLDPGPNSYMVHATNVNLRSFAVKTDTAGQVIWIDTFGSTGPLHFGAVTTDAANDIYITGFFKGTVDFDPGPGQQIATSPTNRSAIFFLKLNAAGGLEWVKVLEGNASNLNQGFDIIASKESGIYVSGTFGNGDIDFDPGPGVYNLSAPVRHIFVAKYATDGSLIWAKSYGGDGPEESCVMDTDYQGNVYLTGQFSTHCDFDPGPGVVMPYPNSAEKLYVLKWDRDGNFKWVRCFVGTGGSSYSNDIDYDGVGNLMVCGGFSGSMDFNDGGDGGIMSSISSSSTFVVKLDTAGNYKWSFALNNSSAFQAYIDAYKNYYICGYYFQTPLDCDPGPNSYTLPVTNFGESYISKYDSAGNFKWARGLASNGLSMAKTVTLDPTGSVYMSGTFSQTADFNPGPGVYSATSHGADDIYLLKLYQCYLNPGVLLQNQTLVAQATGVSYQWINCTTGQGIAGATNVTYNVSQTGSYAVAITSSNGCKDTSNCITVTVPIDPTNIGATELEKQVQLYPNPGSGLYRLLLPQNEAPEGIRIYDILGKEVAAFPGLKPDNSFSLEVAPGIYFAHIRLKNGQLLIKKITQTAP